MKIYFDSQETNAETKQLLLVSKGPYWVEQKGKYHFYVHVIGLFNKSSFNKNVYTHYYKRLEHFHPDPKFVDLNPIMG